MSNKKNCYIPEKRGKVGGQAVLEGVMMKSGENVSLTVRKEDGTMVTKNSKFVSIKSKSAFFSIPIIRGVVNFIESMRLSFSTLSDSADMLDIDDDIGESKFEKWLANHFGEKLMNVIMGIAMVLAFALSLVLFFWLPTFLTKCLEYLTGDLGLWKSVIEGAIKIGIFIAYMLLVSLMKDIRRTFEYHGAEHKSIFCYEAGKELTVENVREQSRFHPRCGTSFMFFMILLGIIAGLFIKMILPGLNGLAYTGIRLLILPILMGLGYEIIMIAGKHPNVVTRAISAPGLWVQRITTKEPTEDMLEVAITSIKCALREDFPEFNKFFLEKGWEKAPDSENTDATDENSAVSEAAPESEAFLDKIRRILDGKSTEAEREAAFARKPTVTTAPKSEEPTKDIPVSESSAEDGSEA